MPTIQCFGAVKLCIYADDHRPPHFHIVGPDFQVLVYILLSHKFSNRNGDIETCPERMEEESKVE